MILLISKTPSPFFYPPRITGIPLQARPKERYSTRVGADVEGAAAGRAVA